MITYKKTIISIFLCLLALPLMQSCIKIFPEASLTGRVLLMARPDISFVNWFNGSIQKYFESSLESSLGLKNYYIRSDNQLNYWLFKESHQKTEERLVFGKNNYIFEQNYINSYIGRDQVRAEIISEKVRLMKVLQDRLKEKNKAFLFVIAPSKANFFNQYIPENQLSKIQTTNLSYNYFVLIEELKKQNVNYLDGRQYFSDIRNSSPAPLFSKSGTHWTVYGSCLVTNKIINELGRQLGATYFIPDSDLFEWSLEPQGRDADLLNLTNIWFRNGFKEKLAYPKKRIANSINNIDLLLIGDSFSWNILDHLKNGPLLNSYDFSYYFSTNYSYPDNENTPLPRSNFDLLEQLESNNAVIIESNEAGLRNIGWDFMDEANKSW